MKKIISSILIIVFFAVISCEKTPGEIATGFHITKDIGFVKYSVMVEFVDASDPNKPINNVSMVVDGQGAEGILESGGTRNFKVIDGKIYLILHPDFEPADGKTVDFSIKSKAEGFLPVNHQIHIAFGEEQQVVTIPMVNLNAPPAGVGHISETFSLSNGVLQQEQTIVVPASGDKITGATVTLLAGTTFYGKDGSPISGSSLKVDLTHFDPKGDAALASFPGGFSPEKVIGDSGEPENVYFVTAGFSSINMTVGNNEVKGFNQPIQVSMTVSNTTNNLDTGVGIAAGDIIPVWSYDVDSGVWQHEEQGTVVSDNGELQLNFGTTHLSWYNLDFYGATCPLYVPSCGYVTYNYGGYSWNYYTCTYTYTPPTGKITINSNSPNYEGRFGEVVLVNGNTSLYYSQRLYDVKNGSIIQFNNAPQQLCKFILYSGTSYYNKGTVIAETAPFYPCTSQITLDVPLPETINLDLKATCFDNTATLLPSFYVYYKASGDLNYSYLTYVNKGKAATNLLQIGNTYDFRVYYNGRTINFTNTVTSKDNVFSFELDDNTCNLIF